MQLFVVPHVLKDLVSAPQKLTHRKWVKDCDDLANVASKGICEETLQSFDRHASHDNQVDGDGQVHRDREPLESYLQVQEARVFEESIEIFIVLDVDDMRPQDVTNRNQYNYQW